MIQANELRIGNWVNYLRSDKEVTPLRVDRIQGNDDYGDCYPIPLTPEILQKTNFEWDIFWQGLTDGNWVLTEGEKGYRIAYGKRRHDFIVYGIEYLHQLQNLYFALTGTELNVQL